jgi:hypothetical protein
MGVSVRTWKLEPNFDLVLDLKPELGPPSLPVVIVDFGAPG